MRVRCAFVFHESYKTTTRQPYDNHRQCHRSISSAAPSSALDTLSVLTPNRDSGHYFSSPSRRVCGLACVTSGPSRVKSRVSRALGTLVACRALRHSVHDHHCAYGLSGGSTLRRVAVAPASCWSLSRDEPTRTILRPHRHLQRQSVLAVKTLARRPSLTCALGSQRWRQPSPLLPAALCFLAAPLTWRHRSSVPMSVFCLRLRHTPG